MPCHSPPPRQERISGNSVIGNEHLVPGSQSMLPTELDAEAQANKSALGGREGKITNHILHKIYHKAMWKLLMFTCSVQFSCSVVSDSLWPHESQHTKPLCPSPTPRVYPNPCPSSQWRHPAISSSVVPFSSCPQSLPASGSFLMSQLFASGGQSIGVSVSASVLPMNTQDWSPLGWTNNI